MLLNAIKTSVELARKIGSPLGLFFISLLLVAGCSESEQTAARPASATADEQPKATAPAPAPQMLPNWYATAMERHQPLGKVEGDLRPLPAPAQNAVGFDAVIDYAAQQQSYSLLIWHDGALVLEHYFEPYDAELRPESASMHKSVLGLVVAAAIDDGFIASVDDGVGKYLAEWSDDPRGDITLRQLLTMSSGLKPLSREGGEQSAAFRYLFEGREARQATLNLSLEQTPGELFYYQDTNPQVLVLALEQATGMPYQQYLSQRLWQRIGADDAYVWMNEPERFPRGNTALMAKARDWLKVGLLIKDGGIYQGDQVISSAMMAEATAASSANPNYGWLIWRGAEYEPVRYYNALKQGAGFAVSAPFKADDMLYFDGFGGQRVFISRDKDLVIVRLGAMHFDWDDAILPNLVIDALEQ